MAQPDNPAAFPVNTANLGGPGAYEPDPGMTLRDWFAGQALTNATICDGQVSDWQASVWFGKYASGITKVQIVAKQAGEYADAMLAERAKVSA